MKKALELEQASVADQAVPDVALESMLARANSFADDATLQQAQKGASVCI